MSEVIVAFWTGTGNTAEMAEYVAEGIREGGAEAKVVSVDDISAADLKDAKAFALGCPSMGVEQLEESTMEPFVEEVCGFASGKTIGLFGSYGWGDGEWMRNWVEQMESEYIIVTKDKKSMKTVESKYNTMIDTQEQNTDFLKAERSGKTAS